MKKVAYMILTANDTNDLSSKVEPLLNSGWKCQGGVCLVAENGSIPYRYFAQAMTRKVKVKKDKDDQKKF